VFCVFPHSYLPNKRIVILSWPDSLKMMSTTAVASNLDRFVASFNDWINNENAKPTQEWI